MNVAIMSINIYICFTVLFFVMKYYTYDNINDNNYTWLIYFYVMSFFILIIQNAYYISNLGGTKCSVQPITLFVGTIVPLTLVMVPIMALIFKLDWNRIFANTFGMLITEKIIITPQNGSKYSLFYNDPNVLLQELDFEILSDIKGLSTKLTQLIGEEVVIGQELHNKILRQYKTKQNVGYFIWLLLTGIVASLLSVNTILLQDCIIE